jgi:hypothetical protein
MGMWSWLWILSRKLSGRKWSSHVWRQLSRHVPQRTVENHKNYKRFFDRDSSYVVPKRRRRPWIPSKVNDINGLRISEFVSVYEPMTVPTVLIWHKISVLDTVSLQLNKMNSYGIYPRSNIAVPVHSADLVRSSRTCYARILSHVQRFYIHKCTYCPTLGLNYGFPWTWFTCQIIIHCLPLFVLSCCVELP